MKRNVFKKLVTDRITRCTELMLGPKQAEYSVNDDVLHNFKSAARMKNESPAMSLWGMWIKHVVSIQDMINKMNEDPNYVPTEKFCNDKFDDNINYTLILEAVVEERRNSLKIGVTDEQEHFQ